MGEGFEFQKVGVERCLKKVSVEGGRLANSSAGSWGDLNSNPAPCF